jgi:hypothetical protein
MTIAYSSTYEQRLQDVRDWLVTVSGLPDGRVLVAPVSHGIRPELPYITVQAVGPSIQMGSTGETRLATNGTRQTWAHRESVYQVDIYGGAGADLIERIRIMLDEPERPGLTHGELVDAGDPRDLSVLLDQAFESRWSMDLRVRWVSARTSPGTVLASTEGTVEVGDTTIIVTD